MKPQTYDKNMFFQMECQTTDSEIFNIFLIHFFKKNLKDKLQLLWRDIEKYRL